MGLAAIAVTLPNHQRAQTNRPHTHPQLAATAHWGKPCASMRAVEITTIRCGDVDIALAHAGAGGRPIRLLHGFTGAKEDLAEWLDRFASARWHAVAPDPQSLATLVLVDR